MKYRKKIISKDKYKQTNWSGGKTIEMYIYPPGSSYGDRDFYWRISSASVEMEESDFTSLRNITRYISPLDGDLKLTHDGKNFMVLKPFEVYAFDGGLKTQSYGRVKDFNLMLGNGAQGDLQTLSIESESTLTISKEAKRGFHIFYSPNSDIELQVEDEKISLERGDLFVLEVEKSTSLNIKFSLDGKYQILYCKLKEK